MLLEPRIPPASVPRLVCRKLRPDGVMRAEPEFSMRLEGSKPLGSGVKLLQLEHPPPQLPPEHPAATTKSRTARTCFTTEAGDGLPLGMRLMAKEPPRLRARVPTRFAWADGLVGDDARIESRRDAVLRQEYGAESHARKRRDSRQPMTHRAFPTC
jgi:hypothetical protein